MVRKSITFRLSAIHLGVAACLVTAASTPVWADATEELRAELAAQRQRLEMLEKKLEAATKEAADAKKLAQSAPAKATGGEKSSSGGLADSVTIYGIADAGVEIGRYGQGTKTRVQSGLGSASRLGFKGERSFGDDVSAYFQLEAGVSIDNGQNTGHSSNISNPGQGSMSSSAPNTTGVAIFSRNTFVGLKSGIGDIRFGRDYVPIYSITSPSDPFTIGGATAFRLWSSAAATRFDNGIYYTTPKFGGIQANLAYSAGMENNSRADVGISGSTNSVGPEDEGKGFSGALSYKDGPLFAGLGMMQFMRQGNVVAPATNEVKRKSWNLAASYDLKFVKFYGHFLAGKDTQAGKATSMDRRVYWLGASAPFGGKHVARFVYGHLDDRMPTNRDSNHFGLGYEYQLDKMTDLYAYYARVSNKNGGKNSLCAGGTCQGYDGDTNLPADFTPQSLMFGARYRF